MMKILGILVLLYVLQVKAIELDLALQKFLHSSNGKAAGAVDPNIVYNLFTLYNQKFHRTGRLGGNEEQRFTAFNDTLHAIRDHFQRGEQAYSVGLNEFSDRTPTELEQTHGLRIPKDFVEESDVKPIQGKGSLPDSFDYTQRVVSGTKIPVIQPIKNQGSCGSCWAFAFVALLEYQYAIRFKNSRALSEQQFVDCSKGDNGCKGGHITNAFKYFQSNSWQVNSGISYPYKGTLGSCAFKSNNGGVKYPSLDYRTVATGDSISMQNALVNYGPLYVSLFAGSDATLKYKGILKDFSSYKNGVFRANGCPTSSRNHAVVIVGYGIDSATKTPYWKVRNSWGAGLGEGGYFRIRRGVNMCGIESAAYFMTK